MRKEDIEEVFRRLPPTEHAYVVFALRGGGLLSVEAVLRFEPHYLVMRGREGGTTDDGRAFFLPYDDISYIKFDRLIKTADIRRMYGETVALDFEEQQAAAERQRTAAAEVATTPAPAASAALDPAAIAKQNLLARIRAARTSGGGPAGK